MGYLKLFLLVLITGYCKCANILYIMPFTSKSHFIMLRPIGLELARRGHNVTVILPFKDTNPPPNYHQVMSDDKKIWDIIEGERPNVFTTIDMSAEKFHEKILWAGGWAYTEVMFNSSEVKHFLKQDNKFDAVISEQFYQESTYALAHKYNAPLILVTTFGNCMRHNILTRNPLQLATIVSEFLIVKNPTSFSGRLLNFYFTVYEYIWWRFWYLNKHETLVKKYLPDLPEPVPSLYELQKNASLLLVNSHFTFDLPIAILPNIVEIGGIHLTKSDEQLPNDLQKILDEAQHGVIYVNFGSNIRSSELPTEKKNAFLNVFRRLKHIVLWKWEDDNLGNKPDNLVIRKWFPQKEILAHPNVKVFISHGGQIGSQEAIFHGVPIVGIPIYSDQYNNLLQAQNIGFGKILEYHNINEEHLESILQEVLTNDTYRIKAKEISKRFKDRPLSALDTAMFWIEYVIRNNGANYMKNPAIDLSWIAYNMLDIYIFIISLVLGFFYVFVQIVKFVNRFLRKVNDVKGKKNV